MKFSEFAGNERVVQYFQKALEKGTIAHAFIFSGPFGVGKATLARTVCKGLLCKQRTPDGACGVCPSCHKFESGNHPDFHSYVPEGLYFKIEEVRSIIHQVSLKPVESKWKTFLLDRAETMRDEASNALLKVLEEPAGEAVFFLITETAESLLPTIRSRCIHFPFQPLPIQNLARIAKEKMDCSDSEALALAQFSHGSLGRALSLNAEQYKEMRDRVLSVLEIALVGKSYFSLMESVKGITVERNEMPERLLVMEELVRDLIVLKTAENTGLIHQDVAEKLKRMSSATGLSALTRFYNELLQTREAILKINANIGLSLQALLLPLKPGV